MARLPRCRLYKRSLIKIYLVLFITATLLNCVYFSHFHDYSFHKNLIWSISTSEETGISTSEETGITGITGKNRDEISALVQLGRLKASELDLRSVGIMDEVGFRVQTKSSGHKENGKIQRKISIEEDKVNVSTGVGYQATDVKQRNVGNEDYQEKTNQLDIGDFQVTNQIRHKTTSSYRCPNNTLGYKSDFVSYGKCKPHRAPVEGCKEAQRLYYLDQPKCEKSHRGDICSVRVFVRNNRKILKARCSRKLCREKKHTLIVKTLNPGNGQHDIVHTFSSIRKLEKGLPLIMEHSRRNEFNYVFLQCKKKAGLGKVVQLLPLNPRFTIIQNTTTRNPRLLNVNIILIDSVSRAHFYRSLPKTIKLFKRWTSDSAHSPARVFDFELFQAVEGHTAENTHALFTGKLFPTSINRDNPPAVGMETLFGHYKNAGYQTSWQEDLCWEGQWGLFVDLALQFDWKNLAPKLKDVFIDTTGITHSSCEVLQKYGLITPFNGPAGHMICYNGKFQHSYFLKYNQETLQAIASNPKALPLLSYMSLSVAHDQYGRRLQTFDEGFSQYAKGIAHDANTITIILADHGNTYTQYTATTQEGRFEMFHPSLFVIIPNEVSKKIGKDAIDGLTMNQRRLITMIDLHQSLMAVGRPVPTTGVPLRGVFTPVPLNRTCDSVELRTPNLCVCEGWDSPTTNDTLKLALVEFAVGQLNNRIQELFLENHPGFPLTRSCSRLQPTGFSNVRQRNSKTDGSLITSLDITVRAGDVVAHRQDTFKVEVQSKPVSPDSTSLDLKLVHYDRLSMFGPYRACADTDINVKLCVCSKKQHIPPKVSKKRLENLMVLKTTGFVESKVTFTIIDEEACLRLIQRVHGKNDAFAYELANVCLDQSYSVELDLTDMYGIKVSRDWPIRTTVAPGSVRFVFSARKSISYYNGNISVEVASIE